MSVGVDVDLRRVAEALPTGFVGRRIDFHRSLPSTMDVAWEEGLAGAPEGTVVLAEEQTAGRGRLARRWRAPAGSSLLLSVVLRPTQAQLARLPMVAALAVVRAIETTTGLAPRLKWPNDVLINGKKVCGVLVESHHQEGEQRLLAVTGIGLNVNLTPEELGEVAYPPTSLSHELGRQAERGRVLTELLVALERYYLAARESDAVRQEWRALLQTLGRRVRVSGAGLAEEGTAVDVDGAGCLLLRRSDGSLVAVPAGDVTLRG